MSKIVADIPKIQKNARSFCNLAEAAGASLTAVTKFCTSDPEIAGALASCGIASIADSNMRNFAAVPAGIRTSLIKTRMSDIFALSSMHASARPDRIFVSDRKLLQALRKTDPDDRPDIVLIAELGDLKDGMYPDEIRRAVGDFPELPIIGVSANFACLSGVMPSAASAAELWELALDVQSVRGLSKPFASVGGTVVWKLLSEGGFNGLATEIRIGEGIFFGYDSSGGSAIPGFERDCFSFAGEIIETAEKKIERNGVQGYTALGAHCAQRSSGLRSCAVLDFGVLAASESDLEPIDPGVQFAGQTFDFSVADITDSAASYAAGGFVSFRIGYSGSSRAYINPYVSREVTYASHKDN